jgi:hypothetical protein
MVKFENVIQQLIETNKKVLDGSIDLKTAQYIVSSTQCLINAAKVQLDILKLTKDPQFFIEQPCTIEKLKELANYAASLNNEPEEEITDKRPFPFSNQY